MATLAVTLLALFVKSPLAYGLAVLALAFEVVAWLTRSNGLNRNELAEEIGRRALIADGLGVSETADAETHLLLTRATEKGREAAHNQRARPYFDSTKPHGPARLQESLEQSAFYSAFLYRKAAKAAFVSFGVLVAIIVTAAILSLLYAPHAQAVAVARVVVVLLSAILARDLLGQGLSWTRGAGIAERTAERLSRGEGDLDSVVAAAGDYATATATRPPISDSLYARHQAYLDAAWAERMTARTK